MWEALIDRQIGYRNFTPELMACVRKARVVAVGAGGNGAVLDLLVRTGFEDVVIIEPDVVEDTNLNRLPFDISAIGLPKTEAWKRHLLGINPACRVETHRTGLTLTHSDWLAERLGGDSDRPKASLVFLGTTDAAANLVTGRVCAALNIRLLIGPASSGAWVVSTFTHTDGLTMENVVDLGTAGLPLEAIDPVLLRRNMAKALAYPGRADRLQPGVGAAMLKGELAARSCGLFVRLTNAAMAFEAVKNIADMHGLPLDGTHLVTMPVVQVFDPFSGCAYLCDIREQRIGIPDWVTHTTTWHPYPVA